MGKSFGVSLGLSNSVAVVVDRGNQFVIPSAEGPRVVPMVVAVTGNHVRLIGQPAHRQSLINPQNTVFHIQRLLGQKFNDPEVQKLIPTLPYKLTQAPDGGVLVLLDGKEYSPTEITAMLLGKHKKDAEVYLSQTISEAVITVPAYFNAEKREATKEAGRLAGLEVVRIIDEPTAACLAYHFDKKKDAIFVVYDFGGITFTVSILDVREGVFSIRAARFDGCLGGDDFDLRITDYLADEFMRENRIDLHKDQMALKRLGEGAEKTKVELSKLEQTVISLPFMSADTSGPKHLLMTMTREKLEYLTGDLVNRSLDLVRQIIKDADLQIKDIDEVVLVGGMARMPVIEKAVRNLFQKEPYKHSPDQIAALGAAIQANILAGEVTDSLFLDVTPLSISIRTMGGLCRTLIERNTTIPCHTSLIFSTASDFQTKMTIQLMQGESHLADRNLTLGRFSVVGLTPAPRGSVQVKIDLKIDTNGILNVSACDLDTGVKQQIKVDPGLGMTSEETKRLIANQQQLAGDLATQQEISTLENTRCLAYVAQHLEIDVSARMNPDLSQRLHDALFYLNLALPGQSAELGAANSQLWRIMSEVFLTLELSVTSPPKSKIRETPVATQSGGANLLAGFHILEALTGGMGVVSIVLKEGRFFAVKTPRDELLADSSTVQRFMAEARTWIGLERHTNIVCALLARESAGRALLFLEYADGGNLDQWLGKLPVPQVLDYAIQLCTGMGYAFHKAGIVHRDLKPANILLSKDKRFLFGYAVKVTDFGLAGVWKPVISDRMETDETQMSHGMGTWPYMPPEQFPESVQCKYGFRPQPVTVRSDIYSFGVLLYEMVTGRRPFQSIQEIFSTLPEEPGKKNKDVPAELSALIMRCLSKSPGMRFTSFDEIASELIVIYEYLTGLSYVVIGQSEELTYLDWIARGASLLALGDYQEGHQCYEKALAMMHEFPPIWQGKGLCLEKSGLFEQALLCYDAALKINPYLEEALLGKARCLTQKNRFGEAIKCYERAFEAQLLTSIGPE